MTEERNFVNQILYTLAELIFQRHPNENLIIKKHSPTHPVI